MKLFASVCVLFMVILVFGTGKGDSESSGIGTQNAEGGGLLSPSGEGGVNASSARDCQSVFGESGEPPEDVMFNDMLACIFVTNGTSLKLGIRRSTTAQAMRAFFRDYCGLRPMARRCVADVDALAADCLNRTSGNVYRITRDLMLAVYDVSCSEEGGRIASVFVQGLIDLQGGDNDTQATTLDDCFLTAQNQVVNRGTKDAALVSLQHYRVLNSFKDCLVDQGRGRNAVLNIAASILDDILKRAPCIHHQLGTEVLCETIANV